MNNQKIITGVTVSDQMSKALEILKTQVIPRELQFQDRKTKGLLSKELRKNAQSNAHFDNHRRM